MSKLVAGFADWFQENQYVFSLALVALIGAGLWISYRRVVRLGEDLEADKESEEEEEDNCS